MDSEILSIGQPLKRENILKIAAQHGAFNIHIFGSVARGEETPDSDIDFLVKMESERNLLDRIGLIQDLENYLGYKVDVATFKSLRDYFRDKILKEAIPV
ncbi:MAG: nucleotidyltransferase family protein [Crocosphaera sp.]|nr:nucleotidyltransferase family protein [Crocosphaera sp.]